MSFQKMTLTSARYRVRTPSGPSSCHFRRYFYYYIQVIRYHQDDIPHGKLHGVILLRASANQFEFIDRVKEEKQGHKTQSGKPHFLKNFFVNHHSQCIHACTALSEVILRGRVNIRPCCCRQYRMLIAIKKTGKCNVMSI